MVVAIENFLQLNALNKVMVLDDMFELGAEIFQEHKAIVELLSNEKNIVSFLLERNFTTIELIKKVFISMQHSNRFQIIYRKVK